MTFKVNLELDVGETTTFRLEPANREKLKEMAAAINITPNRLINRLIAAAELVEVSSVRPVAIIQTEQEVQHDQRTATVVAGN